jgi:abequosyltransferase
MNTVPLLSFCIATMNRGNVIDETIGSILEQIPSNVEVVILDSSSDDVTAKIVSTWQAKGYSLRYERRPPSGFDRDYCHAVAMSRGDYCWLFPDDDLVRPGAVSAVLAALATQPDCVIANAEVRNQTLETLIEANRLGFTEDRVYLPDQFERLAADLLYHRYISYVGAVIIRRSVWDQRSKELYFGSDFLSVGLVLQVPFSGNVIVLAEPGISIRYGVALWTSRALQIWFIKWPQLIWSFEHLGVATKQISGTRDPWNDLHELVNSRALGWLSFASYRKWLHPLSLSFRTRLNLWILCAIPFPWINRWLTARVRRQTQSQGIRHWDLENAYVRWRRHRANPQGV